MKSPGVVRPALPFGYRPGPFLSRRPRSLQRGAFERTRRLRARAFQRRGAAAALERRITPVCFLSRRSEVRLRGKERKDVPAARKFGSAEIRCFVASTGPAWFQFQTALVVRCMIRCCKKHSEKCWRLIESGAAASVAIESGRIESNGRASGPRCPRNCP